MADGDLLVESGKGGGGAGGRVAMDKNYIGSGLLEHIAHAGKHPGGYVI